MRSVRDQIQALAAAGSGPAPGPGLANRFRVRGRNVSQRNGRRDGVPAAAGGSRTGCACRGARCSRPPCLIRRIAGAAVRAKRSKDPGPMRSGAKGVSCPPVQNTGSAAASRIRKSISPAPGFGPNHSTRTLSGSAAASAAAASRNLPSTSTTVNPPVTSSGRAAGSRHNSTPVMNRAADGRSPAPKQTTRHGPTAAAAAAAH